MISYKILLPHVPWPIYEAFSEHVNNPLPFTTYGKSQFRVAVDPACLYLKAKIPCFIVGRLGQKILPRIGITAEIGKQFFLC